jgi:hypothetical protein
MQNKLSLAELKAKANATEKSAVIEKVQGGGWKDCHGMSGGLRKYLTGERDSWRNFP